jgi:hypothetical protein
VARTQSGGERAVGASQNPAGREKGGRYGERQSAPTALPYFVTWREPVTKKQRAKAFATKREAEAFRDTVSTELRHGTHRPAPNALPDVCQTAHAHQAHSEPRRALCMSGP